jgi:hypothetical protein
MKNNHDIEILDTKDIKYDDNLNELKHINFTNSKSLNNENNVFYL